MVFLQKQRVSATTDDLEVNLDGWDLRPIVERPESSQRGSKVIYLYRALQTFL